MQLGNTMNGNKNSHHYGSQQAEAIITVNPETCGVYAMTVGQSLVIENCGPHGHVWKEMDFANMKDNIAFAGKIPYASVRLNQKYFEAD